MWDKTLPKAEQAKARIVAIKQFLESLKAKADACCIEFMCSAFSPEFADLVNPFVAVHKIASSENTWPQLLERIKSYGKPIVLSTGALAAPDFEVTLRLLSGAKLVLLYCSSAYPSVEFNLFQLDYLKQFGYPVGYSDHSTAAVYPALSAVEHFGATVIEKHVNFTKHTDTPDMPHSLNGTQFKMMCGFLRKKEDPRRFLPHSEEQAMFLRHNRRLVATRPIRRGQKLKYGENFGAYRSRCDDGRGLHAMASKDLDGLTANVDLVPGQSIGPGDFVK